MKIIKLLPILLLIGCTIEENPNDCGCTKVTYKRTVVNNHIVSIIENISNVECQEEGSADIDNTHYYTITCN